MITIIEVDQWTSTGNIEQQDFDTLTVKNVQGGDSQAAKDLGIAHVRVRKVEPFHAPLRGFVWYVRGDNGKCEFYKENIDSSD